MPSNITHTSAGFAAQIRKFVEKSNLQIDEALRATLVSLSNEIVLKTPVDTGRLSGNWQFGVDVIPDATIVPVPGEGPGNGKIVQEQRKAELEAQILNSGGKLGSVFYLVNNLPYAPVVEYGLYPNPPKHGGLTEEGKPKTVGGFSMQAPYGMVRLTAAEFQNYVRDTVAQMKD
jgi:hypothetical protein